MTASTSIFQPIIRVLSISLGLLLIPLVAMYFTDEVNWTIFDFLMAGVLLFSTGLGYIFISRFSSGIIYKIAVGLAALSSLLLIWVNLAVGLIGNESDPINLWYFGILALGFVLALFYRFEIRGLRNSMFMISFSLMGLLTYLLILKSNTEIHSSPPEVILIHGFFMTLFFIAGILFSRSMNSIDALPEDL